MKSLKALNHCMTVLNQTPWYEIGSFAEATDTHEKKKTALEGHKDP